MWAWSSRLRRQQFVLRKTGQQQNRRIDLLDVHWFSSAVLQLLCFLGGVSTLVPEDYYIMTYYIDICCPWCPNTISSTTKMKEDSQTILKDRWLDSEGNPGYIHTCIYTQNTWHDWVMLYHPDLCGFSRKAVRFQTTSIWHLKHISCTYIYIYIYIVHVIRTRVALRIILIQRVFAASLSMCETQENNTGHPHFEWIHPEQLHRLEDLWQQCIT